MTGEQRSLSYRKGDPSNIDNYRGISVLSLPGKVLAILLKKRWQTWDEAMLMEEQYGFRTGRSCNDAIFSLQGLCELTSKAGHDIHTCFIDLSKPMILLTGVLLGSCLRAWDFPTRCCSSSQTSIRIQCVQCKRTEASLLAGSRFLLASSRVM